jgi:TIR domain/Pentapeptide repeats (8 copies)
LANQEQLSVLRRGLTAWNIWREGSSLEPIDLRHADLHGMDLCCADLSNVDLAYADLRYANLHDTKFGNANLGYADLRDTDLHNADLHNADLSHTNLRDADLGNADLRDADLRDADLSNAKLNSAYLARVDFSNAKFRNTDFSEAITVNTIFGNVDLRSVKGLGRIWHDGPSTIGTNTLERSEGDIPDVFLRGVGLGDTFIEYARALVQSPIQYYTCFISYSSQDQQIAERLHADLQQKGIRCWFAPHDMRIGDKIRHRIDESIRLYDKLLLLLSEYAVKSQWVEYEVETAIGKELEGIPNVLFPIRLNDAMMESKTGWASYIKLTRHIGDFTHWKNHDAYLKSLQRLIRDLEEDSSKPAS